MNVYVKTLCMVSSSVIWGASTLLAQEKSPLVIIDKVFVNIEKMDKYTFEAKITEDDVKEDGSIVQYHYDTIVKVDRPSKLYVYTKGEFLNRTHIINNDLYAMIDYENKNHGQFTVPKNINKALDVILNNFDVKSTLASLIYSNMDQRIKFKNSHYLGSVMLKGMKCDYISFKDPDKEVNVWVTQEEVPRIKAYTTIDTKEVPQKKVYTEITWMENTKISDNDFVFVAPKDSKKISLQK